MNKGFTLIETLTAIAIFAIAFGIASALIFYGYRAQNYAFQQSLAIGEARRGVETMVKEIREARGGDDGSYIIDKTEDFQFSFFSDIDNDSVTEKVRYFISGADFKKGVIEPTGWPLIYDPQNEQIAVISTHVRNLPPIFRYFDGNGVELPAPARLQDTKLMRLYLVINVDPNRPPNDFQLESDVQIRNLKTNL